MKMFMMNVIFVFIYNALFVRNDQGVDMIIKSLVMSINSGR